jgi:hypothetical protein
MAAELVTATERRRYNTAASAVSKLLDAHLAFSGDMQLNQ